jgi:hypothetical protein
MPVLIVCVVVTCERGVEDPPRRGRSRVGRTEGMG